MKNALNLVVIILFVNFLNAQENGKENSLDGKWFFGGNIIFTFCQFEDSTFLKIISEYDFDDFEKFYKNEIIENNGKLFPCQKSVFGNKIMLTCNPNFKSRDFLITFFISNSNPDRINFIGNVYYQNEKIKSNSNCNHEIPHCSAPLYSKKDLELIRNLKPVDKISRKEVFKVLKLIDEILDSKCNQCGEAFLGADINDALIKEGINPITIDIKSNKYSTSGFDNFYQKFENDKEIVSIYQQIIESFLFNKK